MDKSISCCSSPPYLALVRVMNNDPHHNENVTYTIVWR
jgi:hypothetical protein